MKHFFVVCFLAFYIPLHLFNVIAQKTYSDVLPVNDKLPLSFQSFTIFYALGGAMSFYLGIAVILFFEILELLAEIAINLWTHYTKPKKIM